MQCKIFPRLTLFLGASFALFAQSLNTSAPSGCLLGTIYSQYGVGVDQSVVTLRNAATGSERISYPLSRGEYRFDSLPVGKYSVRASAKGLTTVQINDIVVQQNKTSTINVTLPESRAAALSVVEVSEAPEPIDTVPPPAPRPVAAAPQPPPEIPEDAKIMDPKLIANEINAVRDRLALSASQQEEIHNIFQQRQVEIAAIRSDASLAQPARRDKIRAVRIAADSQFRAVLNDDQLDEYQEILRERRERALQRKQEAPALASH